MIITRTPFRVSFAGGGSDLREFYGRHGMGAVVSASVRYYMYICIHPYFHDKIRIKYSRTEDVDSVDEIRHPIVRECLRKLKVSRGVEIASFADIPAGTGLGSSSSFTVGLLNALYAFQGRMVSKERLAAEACEIEIDILGCPIGKQDQYAAAYGGLNRIRFHRDETVDVMPILLTGGLKAELEARLRLYYVGGEHSSNTILAEQGANMDRQEAFERVRSMAGLAEELCGALQAGQAGAMGEILHRGWVLKQGVASGVTSRDIDAMYERALGLGAGGGKLLGAGGAGFLLLHAGDHSRLERELGLRSLPFLIDRDGTRSIFHE